MTDLSTYYACASPGYSIAARANEACTTTMQIDKPMEGLPPRVDGSDQIHATHLIFMIRDHD